uniref:Retrovirus-related Pol polyprotein from transposon TNT 1-94-like beta-barrel domain-containing protein n=1 Tax=Cannabis sativa TaxID=3483 RepID=A0A803PAZ1_CANSA
MSTGDSQTPQRGERHTGAEHLSSPQVTNGASQQGVHFGSGGFSNVSFGNTLTQPFSIKLDRNNYTLWRNLVSTIIRGHRLEGYVNGTKPCPTEFVGAPGNGENTPGFRLQLNPEYEHWVVCDQLLMGWLYGSMTDSIATKVMGCTSARSLWVALENLYGAHSRAKMDDTRTKIQTTRKGGTTMADYLRQKRNWADSLALAGDPYQEAHLIANVLSGLDAEYLTIVCQLEAQAKIGLTWQEMQEILLSFDSKLERLNILGATGKGGNNSGAGPSAALANKQSTNPHYPSGRGNSNFSNNNFGRGSRGNPNRGGNSSGNSGRGRGRGRNTKPTCQVCGRYGHSAAYCYNRYDETFMGFTPNNNNNHGQEKQDPNAYIATPEIVDHEGWYADSGASNHLTSDQDNMKNKAPYSGKDRLTVGDGNQLLISNIGSGVLQSNSGHGNKEGGNAREA